MSDATKSCPFCGDEILAVAKKCRHCSSVLDSSILSTQDKPADYGFFLLLIPIIATFLVFFWVGNMNLLQSPSAALMLILLATVLSTATLAALEVIKSGSRRDPKKGTTGHKMWFCMMAFAWGLAYPIYLYKRKHYGLPSRFFLGVLVTVMFLGCWNLMLYAVEEKKSEVRGNLQRMERSLEQLR